MAKAKKTKVRTGGGGDPAPPGGGDTRSLPPRINNVAARTAASLEYHTMGADFKQADIALAKSAARQQPKLEEWAAYKTWALLTTCIVQTLNRPAWGITAGLLTPTGWVNADGEIETVIEIKDYNAANSWLYKYVTLNLATKICRVAHSGIKPNDGLGLWLRMKTRSFRGSATRKRLLQRKLHIAAMNATEPVFDFGARLSRIADDLADNYNTATSDLDLCGTFIEGLSMKYKDAKRAFRAIEDDVIFEVFFEQVCTLTDQIDLENAQEANEAAAAAAAPTSTDTTTLQTLMDQIKSLELQIRNSNLQSGGGGYDIRDKDKTDTPRKWVAPDDRRCYHCGGQGHISRDCTNDCNACHKNHPGKKCPTNQYMYKKRDTATATAAYAYDDDEAAAFAFLALVN